MPDAGLPAAERSLACPFVAFEDDREGRAPGPDARHRCYAEVRPAPRALAHQEAYCLTSAFSVCPTFLDWARREAAQARSAPVADPLAREDSTQPGFSSGPGPEIASPDELRRNPPRDWQSPPPWMASTDDDDEPTGDGDDDQSEAQAVPPRSAGLSGSLADRFLTEGPALEPSAAAVSPPPRPGPRPAVTEPEPDFGTEGDEPGEADARSPRRLRAQRGRGSDRGTGRRFGPLWERSSRREAYPTLKTRMGLGRFSASPLLLSGVALAIAVVVIFSLPTILGIGNPTQPTASPNGSPSGSAAVGSAPVDQPTVAPAPSAQTYIVVAGDTMSRIANAFGVPLQVLIDANKEAIPNPDKLQLGQEVIIPATAPTLVPNAAPSPSP